MWVKVKNQRMEEDKKREDRGGKEERKKSVYLPFIITTSTPHPLRHVEVIYRNIIFILHLTASSALYTAIWSPAALEAVNLLWESCGQLGLTKQKSASYDFLLYRIHKPLYGPPT